MEQWIFKIEHNTTPDIIDTIPLEWRWDKRFLFQVRLFNSEYSNYEKINFNPRFFLYLFDADPTDPDLFLSNIYSAVYKKRPAHQYTLEEGIFMMRVCEHLIHPYYGSPTASDIQKLHQPFIRTIIQECILPWLHDIFTPEYDFLRYQCLHQCSILTHSIMTPSFDIRDDILIMKSYATFEEWDTYRQSMYIPAEINLTL